MILVVRRPVAVRWDFRKTDIAPPALPITSVVRLPEVRIVSPENKALQTFVASHEKLDSVFVDI